MKKYYVLLGVLALLTVIGISQVADNRTVTRVHALQVVDAAGNIRAELSTDSEGEAYLRFYDQQGNVEWETGSEGKILPLSR